MAENEVTPTIPPTRSAKFKRHQDNEMLPTDMTLGRRAQFRPSEQLAVRRDVLETYRQRMVRDIAGTMDSETVRHRATFAAALADEATRNHDRAALQFSRLRRQTDFEPDQWAAVRRAHRRRPDARILVTGCASELDPVAFERMPEVARVVGILPQSPTAPEGITFAVQGNAVTVSGTAPPGATVSIGGFAAGNTDVLGFTNQNGITGAYNNTTGVLTLSGTSSLANYQTALRSVTYANANFAAFVFASHLPVVRTAIADFAASLDRVEDDEWRAMLPPTVGVGSSGL